VRTGLPAPSPGVDDSVLAAAPGVGRARAATVLRGVLGGIGAVQLGLGLLQVDTYVVAGHAAGGATALSGHLWHESAAWNIAVGAGFAWIALRRARPVGIVPTLTVFVATLTLLSANDVVAGRVDRDRLLSHGFLLSGYLIVVLLTRAVFDFGEPPAGRRSVRSLRAAHRDDAEQPPDQRRAA
jgi:predicted anti-sigma-YlaC factor YlaD